MSKHIVLIGGFHRTKSLAASLIKKGYRVTAVNNDSNHCKALAEIEQLSVFNGDGSKPFILEDANAYNADIAIALTDRDDDNLVICELCKKKFDVKKTVAIISDPKKTEFFYRMGIDSVVCAITAIAGIIEQNMFISEMAGLEPIEDGRIKVSQVYIYDHSPVVNKKISELNLPRQVTIGFIRRDNQSIISRGDMRIFAGDTVVLLSSDEHEGIAIRELTGVFES